MYVGAEERGARGTAAADRDARIYSLAIPRAQVNVKYGHFTS